MPHKCISISTHFAVSQWNNHTSSCQNQNVRQCNVIIIILLLSVIKFFVRHLRLKRDSNNYYASGDLRVLSKLCLHCLRQCTLTPPLIREHLLFKLFCVVLYNRIFIRQVYQQVKISMPLNFREKQIFLFDFKFWTL